MGFSISPLGTSQMTKGTAAKAFVSLLLKKILREAWCEM